MSGERAKFVGHFLEFDGALRGWMLAHAPATPPGQGPHRHGPRYYNVSYFSASILRVAFRKMSLLDHVFGKPQQTESIGVLLPIMSNEVR